MKLNFMLLLTAFLILFFHPSHLQAEPLPFKVGEKLTYVGKLHCLISATLGHFSLEVKAITPLPGGKGNLYQLKGDGEASDALTKFHPYFRHVTSFWNDLSHSSIRYQTLERDGNEWKRETEELVSDEKQCKLSLELDKKENKHLQTKAFPLQQFSQDNLSFLFYLRTLSLPSSPGGRLNFSVVYDCEPWTITVAFIETTELKYKNSFYSASTYSITNTDPKGHPEKPFKVWILNDPAHTIAMLEGSISIGNVTAKLVDLE